MNKNIWNINGKENQIKWYIRPSLTGSEAKQNTLFMLQLDGQNKIKISNKIFKLNWQYWIISLTNGVGFSCGVHHCWLKTLFSMKVINHDVTAHLQIYGCWAINPINILWRIRVVLMSESKTSALFFQTLFWPRFLQLIKINYLKSKLDFRKRKLPDNDSVHLK